MLLSQHLRPPLPKLTESVISTKFSRETLLAKEQHYFNQTQPQIRSVEGGSLHFESEQNQFALDPTARNRQHDANHTE